MVEDQQSTVPAAAPSASGDISSRTIAVLVALTVIFSFVGAWVNIQSASADFGQHPSASKPQTAEVSFVINKPIAESAATGQVVLTIQKQQE